MIAMVDRAKKDFIIGYEYLMTNVGRIPSRAEFEEWKASYPKPKDMNERAKIYSEFGKGNEYYSALEFLRNDPYQLFDDREDNILETWIEEAEANMAKVKIS